MIRFVNDPVHNMVSVAHVLFPKLRADVYFSESVPIAKNGKIQKNRQAFGVTVFEENKRTEIYLHCGATLCDLLESLAHELAHAICGADENHGPKWKKTFELIAKTYMRNHGDFLAKTWWENHQYAEVGIEEVKAKPKRRKVA